jgi:hypothetical protein
MFKAQVFLLLVCCFSSILIAQSPEVKIDRKQLQEPISSGESAVIENPFGDVRLRSGADSKILEIFSVIQNLEPETPAPDIVVQRKDKKVIVTVQSSQKEGKLDRADLVIYVPGGIPTFAKTVHGLIEIKGVTGDVSAVSERGEIIIRSVKGYVQAENKSGSILAELLADATSHPQNFETRTGNITLYFWEGFNAIVNLETSGQITSDFSVDIDYRASEEPDKIATVKIGQEKGHISARTKRGNISILRLMKQLPQAKTN